MSETVLRLLGRGHPGERLRWLVPVIYFGCAVAFAADMTQEIFYIPFGIFYVPLVCTAIFNRKAQTVWWLTWAATVMVVVGYFFPVVTPNPLNGIVTRALSLLAIFVTATLIRYARRVQEALTVATERAEAAERAKSDVLNALSEEMRNPLQSMIAVSEIMLASCGPEQKSPLMQAQQSSKRLMASVANLLDLANLDERHFASEPVDVNGMIVQAAEDNRRIAAARQISVELDLSESKPTATTDSWAVRRILDNLISNAVRFSPAGGTVELAAGSKRDGAVELQVRDAGTGIPPEVLRRLDAPTLPDSVLAPTGGTGLALCRRLAFSIGAELVLDSQVGNGTTATLRLRSS